jgi:hypothetical protein
MKKMDTPSGLPAGILKLSDVDLAELEGKNTAVARMLDTREVRQALAAILPDLLNVFAGDRRIKKFVMKLVGKYLHRSLSRPEDVFERAELGPLFDDPRFIRHLADPLPELINGLFDLINAATETIEKMDTDDKKEIFGDLISKLSTGQTGEMITRGCRILNDLHTDDPEFFAKRLEPGFKRWVESVDFGELKEAADNSASDIRAFVVMANNVMWQYPSKVVLLLSLLPTAVNMVSDSLDISVTRLNELPPDLLTDVILSFIREINTRPVSGLFNQLAEVIRKVHTGSALLGEPGSPQLPKVLSAKIEEIVAQIDAVTLWKSRLALAETKAVLTASMADAVDENPNLRHLALIKGPEITNIKMKAVNRRLARWDMADDDTLARSMANHLHAFDIQEIWEAVNNWLRLFNRIGDEQPELFSGIAAQLAEAVDDYELSEAAKKLFLFADTIKPAARSVVPGLVKWVADVLAPADDEYEDDAKAARAAMASLLAKEEA